MKSTQKLDQRAWIHAGFRALSERGPTALKAESLARELGVSKGSFYWHFANIGVFQAAMIDYWVDVATAGIVEAVEAGGGSAQARLERLVYLATEPPPTAVGGPAVEGAIRCWARADNAVGERLRCVEADRIAYCKKLFSESGQAKTLAGQNARLLYAGLIGLEQLQAQGLAEARADLLALLKSLFS